MNKILFFILLFFIFHNLNSQLILIDENFDGMTSGSVILPSGWTQLDEGSSDISCGHGLGNCNQWRADNDNTPSSGTGPTADHTGFGQEYVYVESSNNSNPFVSMTSPAFNLNGNSGELSFWVNNYNGYDSPSNHRIEIDVIDAVTSSVIASDIVVVNEQFISNAWSQRVVDLSAYSNAGSIKLEFRWDLGDNNDFRCDMCIDDVLVTSIQSTFIGCWPFDGDPSDASGSNDGVVSGAPLYDLAIFNDGIILDGVDDQVAIAHNGLLAPEEYTIMTWVRTPVVFNSGQEVIFENDRTGPDWYALYKNSSSSNFRFRMGSIQTNIPIPLGVNIWYHIAITYASGTAEFFINGTSQGELTGLSDLTGSPSSLTLGNNAVGEAYEGIIDDFKIIDSVLSISAISENLAISCSNEEIEEICFNGVDDNNDGLIDNADPKCCDPLGTGEAYFPAGDASALGNNTFQVTPDLDFQAGAAWYKARANLAFDFRFDFQINLGNKDEDGADGLAFVMHNDSRGFAAFGNTGIGLGYSRRYPISTTTTMPIEPSVAIEFDTWYNTEDNIASRDLVDDHTSITFGGDIANVINVEGVVCLSTTCANVEDGADHAVTIEWIANSQSLTMSFDGNQRVSYVGDIVNQYLNGSPTVFFGFTGSTGGSANFQQFSIDSLNIVLVEICGNGEDDDCNGLIDENDSFCKNRCGNIVNANIVVTGEASANEAPFGWSTGNPNSLSSTTSATGTVNLGAVNLDDADNLTVISGEVLTYNMGPTTIFGVPNVDGEAQFMMGQETDGILQVISGLEIGTTYRFSFDVAFTWLSSATIPDSASLQLLLDPSDSNLSNDLPQDSHTWTNSNTVERLTLEFTATLEQHEVIIYAPNLPVDYVWFLELSSGNCGVSRDITTNYFIPAKLRNG